MNQPLGTRSLQGTLERARKEETKYRWLQSIQLLEHALDTVTTQRNNAHAGEITERIGLSFQKAAMQAENPEEFTKRMGEAVKAFDAAHGFYKKMEEGRSSGRMLRCRALTKYVRHWLVANPAEKMDLLNECWHLTKEALSAFEKSGDRFEYCETYHALSSAAYHIFLYEWDSQINEKTLREAVDYGERAITLLSASDKPSIVGLARVYAKTAAFLSVVLHYFLHNIDDRELYYLKARSYWEKAYGLAADAALLELLTIPHDFDHLLTFSEILVYYEEALGYARLTLDKNLIGTALDMLAYATSWKCESADPDERVKLAQEALQYSLAAKEQFTSLSIVSLRGLQYWPEAPHCEYYWYLAQYETDLKKKRDLLNGALIDGTHALELAKSSGVHDIVGGVHHALSRVLVSMARIGIVSEKRALLENALEHRKESIRINDQRYSSNWWNQGVGLIYLADIKAELADLEKAPQDKTNLLAEAVTDKERGIQLCILSVILIRQQDALFPWLGRYRDSHGELLHRLYLVTRDEKVQRRAIQVLEEAAETFLKIDLFSRAAECYWKAGRLHDDIGEHLAAADNFALASSNYTRAIERVPQLEDFYRTYACYMDAWREIEQARHHHEGRQYEQAQEHYSRAAALHQSTGSWSYLSPNYLAWARVEASEHLSRSERTEDARNSFLDASRLFMDAKQSIEAKMDSIEDVNERELAKELVKASAVRHKYCLGRIALEEARILDRQGEHLDSSMKYGSAASAFKEVADVIEEERDRQEIVPIIELSKAWQVMTQAEAEISPELYARASQLFERVKEQTTDERARVLALGNSVFCKALEMGTRFENTRDQETYSLAKKYLMAAENYYVKAGFQNESEYATATHRLLDAYWYLYRAETEVEPHRKTQQYQISAKLLQTSIDSYSRARHPEKTEQVQRLLGKVQDEQKLTMTLTDVLHAPPIILSTESFVIPSQTREQAVGSERFDHAHIQGKITLPESGVVGEAMECRLDLVNVGKTLGLLIRVEDLVPENWTVLAEPSHYTVEDGSLSLKGRALGSLQSESVTLRVQAREHGSFTVSPRVIYVDEDGAFRSCKPEPATLLVQSKASFEFRTPSAKSAFDYLLQSFIDDYMRKRLALETSGWRTLMETAKNAKIPKSSVYGVRGRSGQAIAELERRGLVETRVFPGGRGRGGRIQRIRIAYEKETVKRHIDQHIMEK